MIRLLIIAVCLSFSSLGLSSPGESKGGARGEDHSQRQHRHKHVKGAKAKFSNSADVVGIRRMANLQKLVEQANKKVGISKSLEREGRYLRDMGKKRGDQ